MPLTLWVWFGWCKKLGKIGWSAGRGCQQQNMVVGPPPLGTLPQNINSDKTPNRPIQKEKKSASHFNCVQSCSYSISVPWVTLNWASGHQKEMSSCFTVFLIHFRSVHLMDQYCFRRPVFLCDLNVVFVVLFYFVFTEKQLWHDNTFVC